MTINLPTPTSETYSGLEKAFDHFNLELFALMLPPCLITLQRQKRTSGYYSPRRFLDPKRDVVVDEIAINPHYFAASPLIEVLQTLTHEMVHQWQEHHGKPSAGTYHNREWAAKMREIGLMPSHTGEPGGRQTGQKMSDYPIDGGAFEKSAERLVSTGFTVHWLDVEGLREPVKEATALGAPAGAKHIPALPSASEAAKKIKVKYQHICHGDKPEKVNVWGRPNLALACGNCGELFQAATPKVVQGVSPRQRGVYI
ncbi:SprT-like domain-containing protein [Marinomonas sp.]|uniref:SprT-like domain-containing protein n=1 Tax=Marinomonas sp. TaxID=1904862 RepID=UPI003A942ECB